MKKKLMFFPAIGIFFLCMAGAAHAADTSVGASVSAGESGSAAYSLFIKQHYEPWFYSSLGQLTPSAELGGQLWTHKGDDSVLGAYFTPGLTFTLFTDSTFHPFLGASVGGAVVSEDKFAHRDLGSHALFKSKGVVGVEFGELGNHRIQGEYTNYSTWGLSSPDNGYNTYGVSYGYSF